MTTVDQQELARNLGISDRRIRQLEGAHVIIRLDGEPAQYNLDTNARRYRIYADRDMEAACREVEQASACVDEMLGRMRAEDIVSVRRQVAKKDGGTIGRLQGAMDLANALAPAHERWMAQTVTDFVIGCSTAALFELCKWEGRSPHDGK